MADHLGDDLGAAEAKHRRAQASVPPAPSPCGSTGTGGAGAGAGGTLGWQDALSLVPEKDSASKGRRGCLVALRSRALHLAQGGSRGYRAVAPLLPLALGKVLGYAYVTEELLQPPDAEPVRWLRLLFHAVFALLVASWLSITYQGPGRVPPPGQASQLPLAVEAALAACGPCCTARPFGSEDLWCDACCTWKPVLAHHCRSCQRCAMWMDQHFPYAGCCLGFRNLRCFLLWIFYSRGMLVIVILAVFLRMGAGAPVTYWLCLRLVAFLLLLFGCNRRTAKNVNELYSRLIAGWPSRVMLTKFEGVLAHAEELRAGMAIGIDNWCTGEELEAMTAAISRVRHPDRRLRGLFAGSHAMESLALVFGEPLGWRWLVPFVAGGSGDPLQPAMHDADACEAWRSLGALIEEHRKRYLAWQNAAQAKLYAMIELAERVESGVPANGLCAEGACAAVAAVNGGAAAGSTVA